MRNASKSRRRGPRTHGEDMDSRARDPGVREAPEEGRAPHLDTVVPRLDDDLELGLAVANGGPWRSARGEGKYRGPGVKMGGPAEGARGGDAHDATPPFAQRRRKTSSTGEPDPAAELGQP